MKLKPRTNDQMERILFATCLCDCRRSQFKEAEKELAALLPELSEQDVSDIANGVVLFDANSIEVIEEVAKDEVA